MAAVTSAIIGGVGLATQAVGMVKQQSAQKAQVRAQNDAARAQQEQERVRERQMQLESMRRQREIYRESLKARATGLANATSAGTQYSSGIQGGFGQISGETGRETLALGENTQIGSQMFALNREITAADTRANSARADYNTGAGLVSLGGALVANNTKIADIGTTLFGPRTNATKVS